MTPRPMPTLEWLMAESPMLAKSGVKGQSKRKTNVHRLVKSKVRESKPEQMLLEIRCTESQAC